MPVVVMQMLLAPGCVVLASMAGRRWGTQMGGLVGGLPIVAGPILGILVVDHGAEFGAKAAQGSLLGLAALAAFVLAYGRIARVAGPRSSLLGGWCAFVIVAVVVGQVELAPGIAVVGLTIIFAISRRLLASNGGAERGVGTVPWWDVPCRAIAALVLVLLVTSAAADLGPTMSGVFAAFPVVSSVLAVFTHAGVERAHLDSLLRGFLTAYHGFAAFCLILVVTLPVWQPVPAFLAATAAALVVQALAIQVTARVAASLRPYDIAPREQ